MFSLRLDGDSMTTTIINEVEQWEATYSPVANTPDESESWGGLLFETYGDDLALVLSVARKEPRRCGHGWMETVAHTSSTGIIS
jgi:hypothetical protein